MNDATADNAMRRAIVGIAIAEVVIGNILIADLAEETVEVRIDVGGTVLDAAETKGEEAVGVLR